ncbi:MAG: class I SAM-dependent DNA methyltransferase [Candidatus Binatia bacterium]
MYHLEESYWWYRGLHEITRDAIARHAPGFESLLDAGCGTGGLLRLLREWRPHARFVGSDFSPHALDFSGRRGFPELVRGRVDALAFRSAAFDVVACNDVLYFEGVDVDRALDEIARVLGPRGVLAINLPAFELLRGSHDRFVHGVRRFTRREMRDRLANAGFEILQASYWNATLFPLIAVLRLLRRRESVAESDLRPLAPFANQTLLGVVRLEARWLRRSNLPFGTSIHCVARKRAAGVA